MLHKLFRYKSTKNEKVTMIGFVDEVFRNRKRTVNKSCEYGNYEAL